MKQPILIACIAMSILAGCKVRHKTVVTADSTITSHVTDSGYTVFKHLQATQSSSTEEFEIRRADSSTVRVTTQPGGMMVWDSNTGGLTISGPATFSGSKTMKVDTSGFRTIASSTGDTLLASTFVAIDSSGVKTKSTTTKTKDSKPSYMYLYIFAGAAVLLGLIAWARSKSPNKSK